MDTKEGSITSQKHPVLVVGGGISGMTTAIELAEAGHEVILIEKVPYLGGRVVKMNEYFPKRCPPYCGLEINFKRIRQNHRITIYTSTTLTDSSGQKGEFRVTLTTEAQYVNNKCTACGDCIKVCPAERPDEFNYNLTQTKAIYIPHVLAFPFKYSIDKSVCPGKDCGKCLEVCEYEAIDLSAQKTENQLIVHSIIFATGWRPYDLKNLPEFEAGKHPDIISNVMMERLGAPNGPTNGNINCLSDRRIPNKIAFIQCAGSRDKNHLPYCSGVCCSATLKQAIFYTEQNSEGQAFIHYIDLRVSGRNEDFLKKVEENDRIHLIKGKVARIGRNSRTGSLVIDSEHIDEDSKISYDVDMIVLATGIVPEQINLDKISYNNNGFIDSRNLPDGIYATGSAIKPMDVSSSVKDSTGNALKAIQVIKTS